MPIDYAHEREEFRRAHTTQQRIAEARLNVDPGFVHHRKIESLVGAGGINIINAMVDQIPAGMPDYLRALQIDHIYSRLTVDFCAVNNVPTLSRLLGEGKGRVLLGRDQRADLGSAGKQPRRHHAHSEGRLPVHDPARVRDQTHRGRHNVDPARQRFGDRRGRPARGAGR